MLEYDHTMSSQKKFGKSFYRIHYFLDQYYKDFGLFHRMVLHHKKGVELIIERFDEEPREPDEQHILEDI